MLRTNTLVSSEGFSLLTLISPQFEMPFSGCHKIYIMKVLCRMYLQLNGLQNKLYCQEYASQDSTESGSVPSSQ